MVGQRAFIKLVPSSYETQSILLRPVNYELQFKHKNAI